MKPKLLLITANLLLLLSISWSGGRIPSKHTGISFLVATSPIALACVEADFTLYRGVAIKTALCASQVRGASHESFEVAHMAGMFTE